jgi:hypothetical protein
MVKIVAVILVLMLLPGWTDTRGMMLVERASPDQPYSFVVHVSNIPKINTILS